MNTQLEKNMVSINVTDVGPIVEFEADIPEPGLFVLKGDQGVGKTSILRSIQLAVDGRTDQKPTKRDGSKRGTVTVGGKTIRITKQVREEGELSIDGLGDLDIAAIHSPKYRDASTRDRHRITGLVRAAGVSASPELFYDLVGGKEAFEAIVDDDALKTDDLVEMSARVKRAIEKWAQMEESKREASLANMRSLSDQLEGLDITAPHDEDVLRSTLTSAVESRASLRAQKQDAEAVLERAALARKALEDAGANTSADAFRDALADAEEARESAADKVADLEKQLAKAQSELGLANLEVKKAKGDLAAAEKHEDLVDRWEKDIEAAEAVECPTDADIEAAEQAVQEANTAVELGIRVRAGLEAKAKAEEWSDRAKGHENAAKRLRDAARDVKDVLSDAIGRISDCPLKVIVDDNGDARLVMETDRSEHEPIDELSDGERWEPLMQIAASSENRMIVLPQAAFGEMGRAMRDRLHELAVQHGCYVITAQVDEGPLRGEAWELQEAAASA